MLSTLNRPYWELPQGQLDEEGIPDMGMMDPTRPSGLSRPRTPLVRLDADPEEATGVGAPDAQPEQMPDTNQQRRMEAQISGIPNMERPPSVEAPPVMEQAIGRDPRVRAMLIAQKQAQEEQAQPGGLRNQGAQTQQYMQMKDKILREDKPRLWQQIMGGILPGVDWHPNITQHRRNLALQGRAADEERRQQVAQANEEFKHDTLLNSQSNRRYNDDYHRTMEANLQSQIEDRAAKQKEQALDRELKLGAAEAYEIPDQSVTQGIPSMEPGAGSISTTPGQMRAPRVGIGPEEATDSGEPPTLTAGLPGSIPGAPPQSVTATLPAARTTPANTYAFKDPVTGRRIAIPNKQQSEVDAETGQLLGIMPTKDGRYILPKGTSLASAIKATQEKKTKTEDLQEGIAAKTAIADKNGLRGSERQHFIYGTPMPAASVINQFAPPPALNNAAPGSVTIDQVPDAIRGRVQQVLDYRGEFPSSSRNNPDNKAIAYWTNKIDPTLDAATFKVRQKTQQAYAGGGTQGQNLTNLNTALTHLGGLADAAEKLDNQSIRRWNTIGNWLLNERGNPQLKPFQISMNAFSEEMARALKGGVATKEEIDRWMQAINSSDSPAMLRESVKDVAEVIRGRILNQEDTYARDMGKPPKSSFLSPRSQAVLDKIGGGGQQQGGGGGNIREQQSPSTGQYRHSVDGGKSWQPGRAPRQ